MHWGNVSKCLFQWWIHRYLYVCCLFLCDMFVLYVRSSFKKFSASSWIRSRAEHFCRWQHKSKVGDRSRGNSKSPFPIATRPRCREGRYSFPWIAPLYPWNVPFNAKCKARRYQVPFFSLWYDSTGNGTPVSLATGEHSTTRPMDRSTYCPFL